MKLTDLLNEQRIVLDVEVKTKDEIIGKLVDLMANGYDRQSLLDAIMEREKLGSTGIGHGVAVPHVKLDTVDAAERGVELRFGAYTQVTEPGPHWHWPPFEQVIKVNVDELKSIRHKAQMLTRDENIVDIELTVQSRIQDPVDYLFQDQAPEGTLQDATETIVREIIGRSDLDFILTEGRGRVAADIRTGVQKLIDEDYKTGLLITSVNMQPAKPPEQVKSAFDDAIKAREDKERLENKAEAYSNQILPQARGEAARIVANAEAYKEKVIAEAEGDASRFLAILTVYERAPVVTRERLYLDAVENVLANTSKVMLDVKEGNNLMLMPLDKMLGRSNTALPPPPPFQMDPVAEGPPKPAPLRESNRGRRSR